jgi:hypothetical protein
MGRRLRQKRLVGLFALAFVVGANACKDGSCEDGDRTYEDGDVWTCSDGCNHCGCHDGMKSTTAIGCPEPPGEAAGKLQCWEGERWHVHGMPWTCRDGCSICTCNDGELSKQSDAC